MEREELIETILDLEWSMFTNASNMGGRAECQDDKKTFMIMRRAQDEIWSNETLASCLNDIEQATQSGINLMTIKYARMMENSSPAEYETIKDRLPVLSAGVVELTNEIMKYHLKWAKKAAERYPNVFSLNRPITEPKERHDHVVSIDNYLRCELLTYSEATLELCLKDTKKADFEGKNLAIEILNNTAKSYGFESLNNLEKRLAVKKNK